MVGPDEEVALVREPLNKYDPNAIQVLNISGTQVGHIPRNISSRLAPLIDRNQVTVEGDGFPLLGKRLVLSDLSTAVIHEGNLNHFEYALSM